jgi:hypothetical protein
MEQVPEYFSLAPFLCVGPFSVESKTSAGQLLKSPLPKNLGIAACENLSNNLFCGVN